MTKKRDEHAALVRELGATPIDYQREDFTRALQGGFDVVFYGGLEGKLVLSPDLPSRRGGGDERRAAARWSRAHYECRSLTDL